MPTRIAARPRRRPPPAERGGAARAPAPAAPPAGAPSAWSWPAGSTRRCRWRGCVWRTGCARCGRRSCASRPSETATLADRCGLRLHRRPDRPAARAHRRVGGRDPAGRDAAARAPRARPLPRRTSPATSGRWPTTSRARSLGAHLRGRGATCSGGRSITDPVPAALAAELSGRPDAADLLDALEHSTGLVVASGPHRAEFRIQELIRTYLSADLYRHGPALAARAAPAGRGVVGGPGPAGRGPAARGAGGRRARPGDRAAAPLGPAARRPRRARRAAPGARRRRGPGPPDGPLAARWCCAQLHLGERRRRSAARAEVRRAARSSARDRTTTTWRASGPPPPGWPGWARRPDRRPTTGGPGAGRARGRRPRCRRHVPRGADGAPRADAATVLG